VTEIHSSRAHRTRLRTTVFAAVLLVLVQAAIGIIINLYVSIPRQHPGAHPSDYFSGSIHSVVWAIAHGAVGLAAHAAFGVALALIVVGIAINAIRSGSRATGVWTTVAALLVIAAGFNGASFLDFNDDMSSLIMALLAVGAVACYSVVMFLLADALDVDP
jgi:hypothetical protein